jgi:hypothetical protein
MGTTMRRHRSRHHRHHRRRHHNQSRSLGPTERDEARSLEDDDDDGDDGDAVGRSVAMRSLGTTTSTLHIGLTCGSQPVRILKS